MAHRTDTLDNLTAHTLARLQLRAEEVASTFSLQADPDTREIILVLTPPACVGAPVQVASVSEAHHLLDTLETDQQLNGLCRPLGTMNPQG